MMRILRIMMLLAILFSCKQEKQKASVTHSSIPKTPHVKEVQTKKNDTLETIYIKIKDTKKIELPFGSEKVKIAKPVTDTVYKVYKEVQNSIKLAIDNLTFKKIDDFKNFETLINRTNDSLNGFLTIPYFHGLKNRLFYLSSEYIEKDKFNLFFLKTIYHNPINKKKIENIYLVSISNNQIVNLLNIYYNYKQSFGFGSRFFFIDVDCKVYSALYDNIEGDISIKSPMKYLINDNGTFENY